jgi:Mlc titration factor MtfA (ptsG expression regulator)
MAKAVEFNKARFFEAEASRMPNVTLHELAHGYHDRVLRKGFANAEIQGAFARAKESRKYDKVARHNGNGRPDTVEKAYAMTNPMEYFAEVTEAYFTGNDFYPFTRDELKKIDPDAFALVGKLWQVEAEPAPAPAPPTLAR